jgi:hypothetical protein
LNLNRFWIATSVFLAILLAVVNCPARPPIGGAAPTPVPQIEQPLVPAAATPGHADLTLTVNGSGFVPGATVNWNGSPLITHFVNAGQLTATVPASEMAAAATASVTVTNSGLGGRASNVVFFQITNPTSFVTFGKQTYTLASAPSSVAVGDFDGDGKLDLAVVEDNGSVSILLGNGEGTFQASGNYAVGLSPHGVIVGDFNGDGKLDLAVMNSKSNTVSILLGNGNGTFQTQVAYPAGTSPVTGATADFNGDGKLDLAIANENGRTISILLGNGDGTFQAPVAHAFAASGHSHSASSVIAADFNEDGNMDLAVTDSLTVPGTVSILLGKGDGTFHPAVDYPTAAKALSVTAGDFNGDGKLDLAVSASAGFVSVLLGKGDGTFEPHVDYATGAYPSSIAVGDFNGDGKLDLATANYNAGTVSLLLGNSDGTFQGRVDFGTAAQPHWVAMGDFNGDGRLDLAVAAAGAKAVSLLLQAPVAAVSTAGLSFDDEIVGTTSTAQTVTLANNGSATLSLSSIVVTGTNAGDFIQSNHCPNSLAPTASCAIGVTFEPSVLGPRTAQITITDNDGDSPQVVPLKGTGVPRVSISPTSLSFGQQIKNTASGTKTVTLANNQDKALKIISIVITGTDHHDFTETNTCGGSVASKTTCTIQVTFTPKATGTRTAAVTIKNDAGASPKTVTLSGTGVLPVAVDPGKLTFKNQLRGTTSPAMTATLTNNQDKALNIASIAVTGSNKAAFAETNTCGTSLAAGANCTISVTFTPKVAGVATAAVTVKDDAGTNPQTAPQTVALSATGVLPVDVAPDNLVFGSQSRGTTSSAMTVTLSNNQDKALNITSIAVTGSNKADFAQTNTCGSSLAAGTTCTISVTFTPKAAGTRSAAVTLTDDFTTGPKTVPLSGKGVLPTPAAPAGIVGVDVIGTNTADFVQASSVPAAPSVTGTHAPEATMAENDVESPQVAPLRTTGALPVSFSATNGAAVTIINNASTSTGAVPVNLSPTSGAAVVPVLVAGTAAGAIADGAGANRKAAPLPVTVAPVKLPFENQLRGTTSPTMAVTLTNNQKKALSITGITVTGPDKADFAQKNTCGKSLAAGANCTISVRFTPTANGIRTASVTITNDASTSPQRVDLTATGVKN